jgi:hypothetical protein
MVCAPPPVGGSLRSTAATALRCSHLINHSSHSRWTDERNPVRRTTPRTARQRSKQQGATPRQAAQTRLRPGGEVEQTGAMSLDELQAEVRNRELLGRPTKPATVKEWWDYAIKRAVLEDTNPNSARLSDFGRQELVLARRRHSPSLAPAARAMLKNVVWPSVVALAALTAKSPEAALGGRSIRHRLSVLWTRAYHGAPRHLHRRRLAGRRLVLLPTPALEPVLTGRRQHSRVGRVVRDALWPHRPQTDMMPTFHELRVSAGRMIFATVVTGGSSGLPLH